MPQLHDRETFTAALRRAVGLVSAPSEDILPLLGRIPDLASLASLPEGTPVWIRADLDVADRDGVIGDDPRLAGLHETLAFGRRQGWRMLLIGHRGRKPDMTLEYVRQKLRATEEGCGPFIQDWFDEREETLSGIAIKAIEGLKPGHFLVFENVRRYAFETRLWKASEDTLPEIAHDFERLASAFPQGATVYVNDAIASGNRDFSTTALPLAMGRVALGAFTRWELSEHVARAREAGLVSFSGLKLEKLKTLHGIVLQGRVERILAGGSLAMALLAARGALEGKDVSIGAAGKAEHRDAKTYVPPSAIQNGRQLLQDATERGVDVVLPIDFVLEDGSVVETIPDDAWQRDIGPATRRLFDEKARAWAEATDRKVAFHNGVMGQFEVSTFAAGTEALVATLVELQAQGVDVYVGGGEGRAALERFASLDAITHAFTAGGTILKCLAGRPLPFLVALAEQAAPDPA
ncbi:MAG: phosphoglycerate kinase [Planctomycetota bacterium]